MGTSIWLIFLIPGLFLSSIFGTFFGDITGRSKAEIILPYDESQGLVWEYDNQNDRYIDLVEVKYEGSEQIFVFKANDADAIEDITGRCMDLVFTDKNGNQKTYYAPYPLYGILDIYNENECLVAEYTAVAENPAEDSCWVTLYSERDNVVFQPLSNNEELTFTVVCFPDDINELKAEDDNTFKVEFRYEYREGVASERITILYDLNDNQLEIKDETHILVK